MNKEQGASHKEQAKKPVTCDLKPVTNILLFSRLVMELGLCEQLIQNVYIKNPASLENISQLTSQAWGKNKATCVEMM